MRCSWAKLQPATAVLGIIHLIKRALETHCLKWSVGLLIAFIRSMSKVALFSTYVETGNDWLKFDKITITEISEWLKNPIRGSFCYFFSDSYELPTENSLQFKVLSKEEGGSFSSDDFQISNKVLHHQQGTRRRKRCKEANRTFWWNVTKMAEKMKHRLFLWRSSIRFRSPRCQG